MEEILQCLDDPVRQWVTSLTPAQHASLLNTLYTVPDVIQTLSKKSIKGSAEIGKSGEDMFARICQALPINYSLVNTAKQGHKGDFVLIFEYKGIHYRCLVDIKKYTTTVPKKELDKFHEDLLSDKYDCGMILSITSRLVGYPETITISDHHGIPTMYLSDLLDEKLITQAIQLLCMSMVTSSNYSSTKETISNVVSLINTAVGYSNSTRQVLRDLEKSVQSNVQKCTEHLLTLEVQIDHAVKMLLPSDVNEFTETKNTAIKNILTVDLFAKKDKVCAGKLLALPWKSNTTVDGKYVLTTDKLTIIIKPDNINTLYADAADTKIKTLLEKTTDEMTSNGEYIIELNRVNVACLTKILT